MGFTKVGDIDPAGYKLGHWVPVRLYQLLINACDDSIVPGQPRTVESAIERLESQE